MPIRKHFVLINKSKYYLTDNSRVIVRSESDILLTNVYDMTETFYKSVNISKSDFINLSVNRQIIWGSMSTNEFVPAVNMFPVEVTDTESRYVYFINVDSNKEPYVTVTPQKIEQISETLFKTIDGVCNVYPVDGCNIVHRDFCGNYSVMSFDLTSGIESIKSSINESKARLDRKLDEIEKNPELIS